MPEGPEVQVVVDSLKRFKGKKLCAITKYINRPWIVPTNMPQLIGQNFSDIERIGKFIKISFEENILLVHLSFTGSFDLKENQFSAFSLLFSSDERLFFSDKRGLARLGVYTEKSLQGYKTLSSHGMDGLVSSPEVLEERLLNFRDKNVQREIKPFLQDYKYICGIGNIYSSEICFNAKVHPEEKVKDLSNGQIKSLSRSISFILRRAYNAGGSTIESFSDLSGHSGNAQDFHKVYYKNICEDCGGQIMQIIQEGRSTFFCPECQRRNYDNT